jgi:hypothetical protein
LFLSDLIRSSIRDPLCVLVDNPAPLPY